MLRFALEELRIMGVEVNKNKYGNHLSAILNFDKFEHKQTDNFIITCLEYDFQYFNKVYFTGYDIGKFAFSTDKQDYPFDYFRYGYHLAKDGLPLPLVETLMEIKLHELLENLDSNDKLSRFCLFFIKAIIPSLQKGDMAEFLHSCDKLTSDSVDLQKYKAAYSATSKDIAELINHYSTTATDSEIADIVAAYGEETADADKR